ncbi:D-alanyl-D-alanine carboxypeptidase family protein [Pontibacillus litoralis]|uniref:serine-type D-Ala-D-Ala carboxypeptidase n=1 Tax=Pontibacillus litoralis JSM 072002 TaxID=1385512 RepID=A0A0A5FYT8_9BACI|nr:D-alanyl-D-alanine carboxypeptidase family protein [Pontibacillus litoralis]KGX85981.1 D-alanyl-D-alanine carboxypeptidase [Pontibacillus litoralis JSM 072002]
MKTFGVFVTIVCIMLTSLVSPTFAAEEKKNELVKNGKSAILLERDTGSVLYEKNADEKLPPASMTKIMTLILIMEALDKGTLTLEEKVRASENAASMGGSQIFLEAGEEMTVEELLKGVAIASGNDASVALAERIAGSEEAFVEEMNKKSEQLGLTNTKFQNTTGLPAEDHYSTAEDMAIMAKELLKYEHVTNYTSIYEDYLRKGTEDEFWLVNTNKLVKFYPGVDGLKTGYTKEAQYCLTATANKDDMRVIAVVMGAESPKKRNESIMAMLDYAYNTYETESLYKRHEVVDQWHNIRAKQQHMDVVTNESVSILKRKGEQVEDVQSELMYNDNVKLPLKKGQEIGVLKVTSKGEELSEATLTLKKDVEEAGIWTLWKRSMKELVKGAS